MRTAFLLSAIAIALVGSFAVHPAGAQERGVSSSAKKGYPEQTLAPELVAGITGRVGSISSGYESSRRLGTLLGAGAFYAPSRRFAVGLSYLRTGGGSEEKRFLPTGSTDLDRTFHTGLLNLRVYPWRKHGFGLWVGLSVGGTWQTAEANGFQTTGPQSSVIPHTYQLDLGPDGGFVLGAGVGTDVDLGKNFAILSSFNYLNHNLSTDPMSGSGDVLIPGAGSTGQLDVRLGLQYRFDLGPSPW